jgi:DNA processing protein
MTRMRRPSDLRRERWRGAGGTGVAGCAGATSDSLLGPADPDYDLVDPVPLTWAGDFAATSEDRDALLVLLGLASLTARRLLEVAAQRGPAAACLEAVRAGRVGSKSDRARARSTDPASVRRAVEKAGARLLPVGEPAYPVQLLDLYDPPAGLFVRGAGLDGLERPSAVAIVGARACSSGGKEMGTLLGRALGAAGVWVVSGGARGIDTAAHRGALQAHGRSVAVLGCGIDQPYPASNRRLLDELSAAGAVVSEYPPGMPAEPFRFPARNRIIAALSRAVVVVEGARGSGSMITADHGLDLGREVFAVPGAPSSALAAVPLWLIRDGARLIRSADDLLEDLGIARAEAERGPGEGSGAGPATLEHSVWNALSSPMAPDALAAACASSLPDVMAALALLEIKRRVRQVAGRYERTVSSSAEP